MAECDFSWFKLASFLGAALLAILAFALVASGIYLIIGSSIFYGVASILGGTLCGVAACQVYNNYQQKGNH